MSRLINIQFLLLFLFSSIYVLGQEHILSNQTHFELISVKDGLPANSANAIIQDKNGYIWIGSFGGISRYDGYEFKTYRQDKENPENTLVSDYVMSLYEDSNGYIWIGTMLEGLQRFDPSTETFLNFPPIGNIKIDNYVNTIKEDLHGNIWVGTTNGLYKISSPNSTFQKEDLFYTHFPAKAYPDTLLNTLHQALNSKSLLAGISKSGKQVKKQQTFSIPTQTTLVVQGTGEYGGQEKGLVDYGWITNAAGRTVWKMDYSNTYTATSIYNRSDHPCNRRNIELITLEAGTYQLHYQTNEHHHYEDWEVPRIPEPYNMKKGGIPAYPELWGIQIFNFQSTKHEWVNQYLPTVDSTKYVSGSTIIDLHIDDQQQLWVASSGGLDFINTADSTVTIQHLHHQYSSLDFVSSILSKKDGTMWFAGHQLNPASKKYELLLESYSPDADTAKFKPVYQNSAINHKVRVLEKPDSTIWMTAYLNGLSQLVKSASPANYDLIKYPFSSNYAGYLFCDNSNALWVGFWKDGIYKLNPSTGPFNFFPLPNELEATAFVEDHQQNIFIGTNKGDVYKWNKKANTLTPISTNIKIKKDIVSLVIDEKNRLWIGLNQGGVFLYDLNTEQAISDFLPKNNSLEGSFIRDIQKDELGTIWISNNVGIYRYFIKTHQLVYYPTLSDLLIEGAHSMLSNKQQMVLAGNLNSMYTVDLSVQILPEEEPKSMAILKEELVYSMAKDKNENLLWVGSKSGLHLVDNNSQTTSKLRAIKQLKSIKISNILPDALGNLWLSMPNGIGKYHIESDKFNLYGKNNGIELNEYHAGPVMQTSWGEILVGGAKGLYHYSPESIKSNTTLPTLQITKITLESKESIDSEKVTVLNPKASITLQPNQNTFEINYVGLHYDNPKAKNYSYRMLGLYDDWIQVGKERNARYIGLSPGKYTFQVKASNADGVWNETGAKIDIHLLPPWWKTTSAYLLYLMASIGTILWLYFNQIRRIKLNNQLAYEQKEAERLAELDRLKTSFFSNITHEFRTPLTLIIEPARQLLKNWKGTKEEKNIQLIEKNSQQLLGLVNQLLDLSKLEDKKMSVNLRKGDLYTTIEPIINSFQSIAKNKGIRFVVKQAKLEECYFDKEKVEKILNNLLSNAFKFTEEGTIILTIKTLQEDTQLSLIVEDSGIGIAKKQLPFIFDRFYQADSATTKSVTGTGIGLALTKELIELLDGTILVNSTINKGSTFYVTLPLMYELDLTASYSSGQKSPELSSEPLSSAIPSTNLVHSFNSVSIEPPLVLLVEDNPELRDFIKQSLEDQYKVLEAENGAEGIDMAKKHIPDVIISDIMMPVKDGYELCNTLKHEELTAHIPIILLTAKSAIESKIKGLRTGADAYLTKPFYSEELLVRIKKLIELRKKLQDKYSNMDLTRLNTSAAKKNIASKGPKETSPKAIKELDQQFLERFTNLIAKNVAEDQLSIDSISKQLFISRSQLHRKIKALTGLAPSGFIRNYRLDYSLELLKKGPIKISHVANEVGFSDEKYFSRRFKERFGYSPSEVATQK